MALSRDGQSLVLATPTDRNAILIVRTSNGEVVKAIEVSSPVSCLDAGGAIGSIVVGLENGEVRILRLGIAGEELGPARR